MHYRKSERITILNDGPILQLTNYFDTVQAERGEFFLTWNVGAARLLIPENQKILLREMRSTDFVVITYYKNAIEIMFDDNSDAPFKILLPIEQTDEIIKTEIPKIKICTYIRVGMKEIFAGEVKISPKFYG